MPEITKKLEPAVVEMKLPPRASRAPIDAHLDCSAASEAVSGPEEFSGGVESSNQREL